ncbi:zinc-binding dehydrogenase [uncultured Streptomyces sp.]|uniref:zinc-binding dehydrogenase n=1 Tax=uncultured Streptomyces sp. TaxID=174707 RepID=UPI002613700F|nr:zinc-binding dehydrogenase [uncultured Streptomyces sp.]
MAVMRAARLHIPSRELRIEEVERPVPGPGQVLVKVEAAGVCLSDVHLISGAIGSADNPRRRGDSVTLGHEVAGTVAEAGPGVTGWMAGDRVVLQAGEERDGETWTRGVDYDGGWAEYALARVDTLVALPDSISFEQGAIIPDAVSTPWAAITVTAGVRPAQAVGVWGIGGLGAHGVQLLRAVGACPIIAVDPSPAARERALAFGADLALDSADPELGRKIAAATGGAGPEVALDFAGVTAVREQALSVLAPGGKLVLVGLSGRPFTVTDSTAFSFRKLQVLGHYGSGGIAVPELIRLTEGGRLDFSRSISGVLPLERAAEAVERVHHKTGDPIRLVLKP